MEEQFQDPGNKIIHPLCVIRDNTNMLHNPESNTVKNSIYNF